MQCRGCERAESEWNATAPEARPCGGRWVDGRSRWREGAEEGDATAPVPSDGAHGQAAGTGWGSTAQQHGTIRGNLSNASFSLSHHSTYFARSLKLLHSTFPLCQKVSGPFPLACPSHPSLRLHQG